MNPTVMIDEAVSPLSRWENFYVIIGSSAGALTGLQFVVMTLIDQARAVRSMAEIRAFGTPTVVHFCGALLISAVMSAPWDNLRAAGIALVISGVAGTLYAIQVIRHARRTADYQPEIADWIWFVELPLASYIALIVAAELLVPHPTLALFLVAGVALLLLFVGIHNAWDTVTYVAITKSGERRQEEQGRDPDRS